MSAIGWGLTLYAFASLGSMATMSVGAAVLFMALLAAFKGPLPLWNALRAEVSGSRFSKYYFYASLALTLACALSLVVASLWPLGFGGKFVEVHFFRDMAKVWYLFWPLPIVVGIRKASELERDRTLKVWIYTFGLFSILGFFQYYTGWPRDQRIPGNDSHFHVTAFLGFHLSVASIFIFPYFATLDYIRKGGHHLAWVALFGIVALFLTYSRMLWIALPIGLVFWAVWALPSRLKIPALAGLVALGIGVAQVPQVKNRIHDQLGVSDRVNLWKANWEFIKLRPITGTGWMHNHELSSYYFEWKNPGAWNFPGHAHNNIIQMLSGTGLLGFLSWLIWSAVVIWIPWQSASKSPGIGFARGLVCAWIVLHLNGLTQVNVWEGKVQHQMAWVIAWSLFWRPLGGSDK